MTNAYRHIVLFSWFILPATIVNAQTIFMESRTTGSFDLTAACIYVDANDAKPVQIAAALLQQDIESVTGKHLPIINEPDPVSKTIIIIGSVEHSALIQQLIRQKKLTAASINNTWETYKIAAIKNPFNKIGHALVIAGSDRRGTAFGVFEVSRQIGASSWCWWADVPVKKKPALYIKATALQVDSPKVKYRGIFINDEAPALSSWAKEKFGGFNQFMQRFLNCRCGRNQTISGRACGQCIL